MIPENNHYDSLSIFFDYLEDNGIDTSELRENLGHKHWQFVYHYYENLAGSNNIGRFVGHDKDNTVGTASWFDCIGGRVDGCDTVGGFHYICPVGG